MSNKKIVFPKDVIERAKRYDFSDDGNRFKGYLYKGLIPITYIRYRDMVYADIRLDYLTDVYYADHTDPLYDEMREALRVCGIYNGVRDTNLYMNMEDFIKNCETVYQCVLKYRSPQEEIKRLNVRIKAIEEKINNGIKIKEQYLSRINELGGNLLCQQM